MALKADELANRNSCLNKAKADEPIFVLRAQDMCADFAVERWAEAASATLGADHPKIKEAMALAEQMRAWPTRKMPD